MITQEERFVMAIERLVSSRHLIVAGLCKVGLYNLALRVKHDLEALAILGTGPAPAPEISVPKVEVEHG